MPTIPQPGSYRIADVDQTRENTWHDSFGNDNTSYFITLEHNGSVILDEDGTLQWFELARRSNKDAPNIGESIDAGSFQPKGKYPPKIKIAYNQPGFNSGGGGAPKSQPTSGGGGGFKPKSSDEFRDKFQIMRGEALQAATRCSQETDPAAVLALADTFYEWIKGRETTTTPPDREELAKELAAKAKERDLPLSLVAEALHKITGHHQLQADDASKIPAILDEADKLLQAEVKEEVPF